MEVSRYYCSTYACKSCGGRAVPVGGYVRVLHSGDCNLFRQIASRFPSLVVRGSATQGG